MAAVEKMPGCGVFGMDGVGDNDFQQATNLLTDSQSNHVLNTLTFVTVSIPQNTNNSPPNRHVILPKELAKTLPKTRLLSENEWRSIGVQQSRGWQHYAIHRPEPHILLFRRPLGTDPQTGAIDPELKRMALEEYKGQFGLRGH